MLRQGPLVMLERFVWIDLMTLARRGSDRRVWLFSSAAAADQARRSYGRGAWRRMEVQRVRR